MMTKMVKGQSVEDIHDAHHERVGAADDLKEQLRPGLGEGHIAQFVQNQKIEPLQLLLQALQRAFLTPFEVSL